MRWFVEVSRVGDSTLSERYCVEAKAWQAALQETRKLRGDSGPLSKFSIELLDDGYRAVDPVQKIRYLVNQAPSDAPLVTPTQLNGSAHGSVTTASAPSSPGPSKPPAGAAVTVVPVAPVASTRPLASASPGAAAHSVPAAAMVSVVPSGPVVKKVMGVTLGTTTSIPVPSSSAGKAATAAKAASVENAGSAGAGGAPRPTAPRRSVAPRAGASLAPRASAKGTAQETKAVEPATVRPPPVGPVASPAGAASVAPVASSGSAAVAIRPAISVEVDKAPAETPALELPEFETFSSRLQEPTPEAPIAYREVACFVPPGTPRAAVEALLRERLRAAQADFSSRPPGQLIQIAIFDHVFEDRPQHAPLGTLAWKDWRGEPVLGYPAFGEAAPPISPSLPPIPVVSVTAAPPSAAPTVVPGPPSSAPTVVPGPPSVAPTAEVPLNAPPAASLAPEPAGVPAPDPFPAAPSPSPALDAPISPARSEEPEQPVLLQRRASRPDSDRPSQKLALGRRRAGEDLISELFESMHELHFARDIAAGADFLIEVLQQILPCEVTLIQVFDINTRNFVVVRGRGGGSERAVLHRTPDNDALTSEIMRRVRSRAYRPEGDARFGSGRWGKIGVPLRQVLCGPVRQGGRYLGMIELANPLGGTPFHEAEINALDYICEQFADFVASRPVVLDPDVILAR